MQFSTRAYRGVTLEFENADVHLAPVGARLLVSRADFPERHAWLVTGALAGTDLTPVPAGDVVVPWHSGSRAFLEGKPEPG